jgi:hypothetical protein
MKKLLVRLENALVNAKNPVLDDLNFSPRFNKEQFLNVLKNTGLTPTEDLLDLYSWKTGLQTEKALSPSYNFHTFSFGNHIDNNSTSSLYILDSNTSKIFNKQFLPLIYYGFEEDPIMIDLSVKSKTYGSIFYYCPNITFSPIPVPIYDSLSTWIKIVIECYERNVYNISKEGKLIVIGNEYEVVKKYNKPYPFWD